MTTINKAAATAAAITSQTIEAVNVSPIVSPEAATTTEAPAKVAKPRKESEYSQLVLASNAALKVESRKLGYCIKVLSQNSSILKLSDAMALKLAEIDSNPEAYKVAVENCPKSKAGNFSPFYLLQYLYKTTKPATSAKGE